MTKGGISGTILVDIASNDQEDEVKEERTSSSSPLNAVRKKELNPYGSFNIDFNASFPLKQRPCHRQDYE